jgi:hypothetical protein
VPDLPVQSILYQIDRHNGRLSVNGQNVTQSEEILTRKQKTPSLVKIKNEYVKLQNSISQQADRPEGMGAR